MSKLINLFIKLTIIIFPSFIKIALLKLFGAKIGRGCYIGFTLIDAHEIEIGNFVKIGHFNIIRGLNKLIFQNGSKVESFNWITGGGKGSFFLGFNSSIRRFHFFEASGDIYIGMNSVVAGRNSLFFTHGLAPDNLNDVRSIRIGDWCYIGAASRFLPGASVAEGTFVGMGAVVTKIHTTEHCLLVGSPAIIKKSFDRKSPYFDRPFLRHKNHPKDYEGKN